VIRNAALVTRLYAISAALSAALLTACPPTAVEIQVDCTQGVKIACEKSGRVCGYSGCREEPEGARLLCGECPAGEVCREDGTACEPEKCFVACINRQCGSDSCGGECGTCGLNETCDEETGACVAQCVPQCDGKSCGSDGCGGTCGTCADPLVCNADGACLPAGWTCAANDYADTYVCNCGCGAIDTDCNQSGGTVAGCDIGQVCNEMSACVDRVPAGWMCASDKYDDGVICNCECGAPDPDCEPLPMGVTGPTNRPVLGCDSNVCQSDGQCAPCIPNCDGKNCGSDGCGGLCEGIGPQPTTGPTAPSGGQCLGNGLCIDGVCTNPCLGSPRLCRTNNCGDDGCGGSCGTCTGANTCISGICGTIAAPPADNSCKNRCGGSAPSGCFCDANCATRGDCCADKATACCVAQCANKTCGSDGCGGTCGACGANSTCSLTTANCVPDAPTNLVYPTNPAVYFATVPITNNVPSIGGGAVATWGVSPNLPNGLLLSPSTGVISGTPTGVVAAANYTVTASNVTGMTTRVVNIEVRTPPPLTLSYTTPVVYDQNVAITPNTPTFTGGAPTSYSVLPSLPTGLSLNTSSGAITGTPTVITAAAQYTITGTNASGSKDSVVNIAVRIQPPQGLSYASIASPIFYTVNQAIGTHVPSSTGGVVASYSVSPTLPAGLTFSTVTGEISGTPTVITAPANYTVTATNTSGMTSVTLNIEIRVAAPTALVYATNPVAYTAGAAITPNAPSNGGGPIAVYSAPSGLPAGLSIAPSTGIISGTPTTQSAAQDYLITGTNAGGSTNVNLNIEIFPRAPTGLTYAQNPVTYTAGVAIAANTPSSTGGAIASYAVSPGTPLPAGLSIAPGTGIITGTPVGPTGPNAHVITGTNVSGSTPVTLTITVNPAAPAGLSYTTPVAYNVGQAITPNVPSSSGGAVTSYAISPNLTTDTGLTFSTSTGIISGTPTQTIAASDYVVTATNVTGSTMATVRIQVDPGAPGPWAQQAYVKAVNNDANDFFGQAVALDGDTLVVGAPNEQACDNSITNGTGASSDNTCELFTAGVGAVYVYKRTGSVWAQEAYLKASDTDTGGTVDPMQFGTSVAISGNTIVVGAPNKNVSATDEGAVYVFVRSGATWTEQAKLTAIQQSNSANFGHDVAIDADTIVVGARNDTPGGAVYVFTRGGTVWTQRDRLQSPNEQAADQFGYSVSVSGNTLVAGAYSEDGNSPIVHGVSGPTGANNNEGATDAGAAYVFTRSTFTGTWTHQAYLKRSNLAAQDQLGTSVAIAADTIIVGAPGSTGAAIVFTRTSNIWTEQAILTVTNGDFLDGFGTEVALSSNTAIIGAPYEDSNSTFVVTGPTGGSGSLDNSNPNAGAAYVFLRSGSSWAQTAYLKAPNNDANDQYGVCVAVSLNTVAVGANYESANDTAIINGTTGSADNSNSAAGATYVIFH
jgi:hypothetical protein